MHSKIVGNHSSQYSKNTLKSTPGTKSSCAKTELWTKQITNRMCKMLSLHGYHR
uniref:Uncharacterized protein n=1 Tax=Rhizophora mucronata TaxID=61149 RepID=A0A2P2PM12_RHIMU